MSQTKTACLIADIGGTHSRIALWDPDAHGRGITQTGNFKNDEFRSLEAVIAHWQQERGSRPARAILAVAGPVAGDKVELLNRNWSFDIAGLAAKLGFSELDVFNDFYAQARCIPELENDERAPLGAVSTAEHRGAYAILGPGTGLGVAGLTPFANSFAVVSGEGGHVTLPASNTTEALLIELARTRYGHCSAERFVSGSGLELLHELMHGSALSAPEISRQCDVGDKAALATFDQFFSFLGTVAADLALSLGATAGVFITGGVAAQNPGALLKSPFRERFVDKGRYRSYLNKIPTFLITADEPALIGLAAMARDSAQCTNDT